MLSWKTGRRLKWSRKGVNQKRGNRTNAGRPHVCSFERRRKETIKDETPTSEKEINIDRKSTLTESFSLWTPTVRCAAFREVSVRPVSGFAPIFKYRWSLVCARFRTVRRARCDSLSQNMNAVSFATEDELEMKSIFNIMMSRVHRCWLMDLNVLYHLICLKRLLARSRVSTYITTCLFGYGNPLL